MHWRVAVLGHSFARDLASLGNLTGYINETNTYELKFFFISGSCFARWIDWPEQLNLLFDWEPKLIFIVLGSNSVQTPASIKLLVENARIFYQILRNNLADSLIIQCQIELRFLRRTDRHGNPPFETYRSLRNKVNKLLLKCPLKDHFCMIGGKGRLDNEDLYRSDKIHLTNLGLSKYRSYIRKTINYIVESEPN